MDLLLSHSFLESIWQFLRCRVPPLRWLGVDLHVNHAVLLEEKIRAFYLGSDVAPKGRILENILQLMSFDGAHHVRISGSLAEKMDQIGYQ